MGLNISVNILTSGFLVTVVIFLVLMGILFYFAAKKMGEVLLAGTSTGDNLLLVNNAVNAAKVAFIVAWIGAGLAVVLALLYGGHEIIFSLSEYFHLILYLLVYLALIVSVVYAGIALYRIYDIRIAVRNGADSFLWAGLLMAVFAFVGLTATGSGRLGMNAVRNNARIRVERAEDKLHTYLPAIHDYVEDVPVIHGKVHNIHESVVPMGAPMRSQMGTPVGSQMYPNENVSYITTSVPMGNSMYMQHSGIPMGTPMGNSMYMQPSGMSVVIPTGVPTGIPMGTPMTSYVASPMGNIPPVNRSMPSRVVPPGFSFSGPSVSSQHMSTSQNLSNSNMYSSIPRMPNVSLPRSTSNNMLNEMNANASNGYTHSVFMESDCIEEFQIQ